MGRGRLCNATSAFQGQSKCVISKGGGCKWIVLPVVDGRQDDCGRMIGCVMHAFLATLWFYINITP